MLGKKYPFNESHPPLMESIDSLIDGQTELFLVGESTIIKDNFDYVIDPAYNWQNMPSVTPKERERIKDVKAAKLNQVENYLIMRKRYWGRFNRLMFAEDKEYQITTTTGYETTHQRSSSETITETFGFTLGLELSGNLFKPSTGNKVAKYLAAAGLTGGKASTSAEFTYQLSNELRFEEIDSFTYREEKSVTTTETFRGGAAYYFWAIYEVVDLVRKRPNDLTLEPVNDIVAATEITWIDRLIFRES